MVVTDYGDPLTPEDEASMTAKDFAADGRVSSEATRRLRKTFKLLPAEKDREGEPNKAQLVSVTSEKDEERRLLWMHVENEGELTTPEEESETDALTHSIGVVVQAQGELTTAAVAKALDRDAQDRTFKRALAAAVEREFVTKAKRGLYSPGKVAVLDV
jgi:hypothetical protein